MPKIVGNTTGPNAAALREYNVQLYGAKGDGSTNDTTAIHAARDAAGAGGTIYFPPGTYITNSVGANTANQRWILHPQATLKQAAGVNSTTFYVTAANVTLEGGGRIDGNKANVATSSGVGMTSAATGLTVKDIRIQDVATYGVNIPNVDNVKVSGVTVTASNNIGIFSNATADRTGLTVENCTVDVSTAGTGIGGIVVHNTSSFKYRDVRVTGNKVVGPVVSSLTSGICIEVWFSPGAIIEGNITKDGAMGISSACEGGVIVGNSCYQGYWGIEVPNGKHTTVSGNTIEGNSFTQYGIIADSDSSYSTVSGNTVRYTTLRGISLSNSGVGMSASGNVVRHSAGVGLLVNAGDGSSITGNSFNGSGGGTRAITTDGAKKLSISGNSFSDYSTYGVRLESSVNGFVIDDITIDGNVFTNTTSPISTGVSGGASVGSNIKATGNIGVDDYISVSGDIRRMLGTGSPEGVKTAGVGSIYQRTDGAAGATLYVKESGTGNTGWAAATTSNRYLAFPFHIPGPITAGVKTVEVIAPAAMTITGMQGRCRVGGSATYRPSKNGGSADGTTSASTGTTVVSTSQSLALAVGDRLSLNIVSAGTAEDLSVTFFATLT